MKNRKNLMLLLYVGVLILVFSSVLRMFGNADRLTDSELTNLFAQEQVKSFVVDDGAIRLELHEPYRGESTITTRLAGS